MNAFLLVYDSSRTSRDLVSRRLDKIAEITNWYAVFDNTFCISSERDARWLAAQIREEVIPDVRFIVTEIETKKKGGWLPRIIWDFINRPQSPESSAA
ncbi:hypothetical protein EDE12_109119 [Methylosinus sp. sav-2]|uniref:hypothetical protein n=1 Tax=unclassified Methylosinus TaxID=2624500 RepID=UPI0004652306|nr:MULTISPECIES: hypothetical protein [unclassified Methylosinus]TDX62783.1 hypothetical protein EDE12_109119 [Methylosinus sp. sav-2]